MPVDGPERAAQDYQSHRGKRRRTGLRGHPALTLGTREIVGDERRTGRDHGAFTQPHRQAGGHDPIEGIEQERRRTGEAVVDQRRDQDPAPAEMVKQEPIGQGAERHQQRGTRGHQRYLDVDVRIGAKHLHQRG